MQTLDQAPDFIPASSGGGVAATGRRVLGVPNDPGYVAAVQDLGQRYGVDPSTLYAMAKGESGFDPRNDNGNYAGLYQIGHGWLKSHGYDVAGYKNLNRAQQLGVFEKYLSSVGYRPGDGEDQLMLALPFGARTVRQQPPDHVVWAAGSPEASGNPGWQDTKGNVTVGSALAYYKRQFGGSAGGPHKLDPTGSGTPSAPDFIPASPSPDFIPAQTATASSAAVPTREEIQATATHLRNFKAQLGGTPIDRTDPAAVSAYNERVQQFETERKAFLASVNAFNDFAKDQARKYRSGQHDFAGIQNPSPGSSPFAGSLTGSVDAGLAQPTPRPKPQKPGPIVNPLGDTYDPGAVKTIPGGITGKGIQFDAPQMTATQAVADQSRPDIAARLGQQQQFYADNQSQPGQTLVPKELSDAAAWTGQHVTQPLMDGYRWLLSSDGPAHLLTDGLTWLSPGAPFSPALRDKTSAALFPYVKEVVGTVQGIVKSPLAMTGGGMYVLTHPKEFIENLPHTAAKFYLSNDPLSGTFLSPLDPIEGLARSQLTPEELNEENHLSGADRLGRGLNFGLTALMAAQGYKWTAAKVNAFTDWVAARTNEGVASGKFAKPEDALNAALDQAAAHFGVDRSQVRMGPDGKPIARIQAAQPTAPEAPPPGHGHVFVSPYDQAAKLTFDQAAERMASPEHAENRDLANSMAAEDGLKGRFTSAIGDFKETPEDSYVGRFDPAHPFESLRTTGARIAREMNQLMYLVFKGHPDGEHVLTTIDFPRENWPQSKVRDFLTEHGVNDRTIEETPNGIRATIYSEPGEFNAARAATDAITAQHPEVKYGHEYGHGELVGDFNDRDIARSIFDRIIAGGEDAADGRGIPGKGQGDGPIHGAGPGSGHADPGQPHGSGAGTGTAEAEGAPGGAGRSVPVGPAETGGVGSSEPQTTGLSMAQRTEEAAGGSRNAPKSVGDLTNEEAHAQGRRLVVDGKVDPNQLLESLAKDKRAAKPIEYGAILEGKAQLERELNKAHTALDGSDTAQLHYNSVKDQIDSFNKHLDTVKGASGSSLQALKIRTTVDESNFAQARAEYMRKTGSISEEAERQIAEHANEIQRLSAEAENLRKQLADSTAKTKPEQIEATMRRPRPQENPTQRQRRLERIKADRAKYIEDYKKSFNTIGVNPLEPIVHLGKIAWTYADELGTVRLPDLLSHVKTEVKKATGKDVSDQELIDGMHAARPMKTAPELRTEKESLLRTVRRMNSEAIAHSEEVRATKAAEIKALKEQKVKDTAEAKARADAVRAKRKEYEAADRAVKMARRQQTREAYSELDKLNKTAERLDKASLRNSPAEKVAAIHTRIAEIDAAIKRGDVAALTPKKRGEVDLGRSYEKAKAAENAARSRAKVFLESAKGPTAGSMLKNWARTSALSGISTFQNLAAAVAGHVAVAPVEEALGPIVRHTVGRIGGLAEKAGTELHFNPKAEYHAAREIAFTKQTWADIGAKLIWREGSINERAIGEGLATPHSSRANPLLRTETGLHSAVKTPTQRNAFAREWTKALDEFHRQGRDINSVDVRSDAFIRAYGAAERGLLMNDTLASRKMAELLNIPKSDLGKGVLKTMVPISKIPVTIAGRSLEYSFGSPYAFMRHMYEWRKGTMTTDSAAAIARAYKRGGVGLGLAIYAANDPKIDLDKDGSLVVHGYKLPRWASHVPWLEPMTMGVLYRQAHGGIAGLLDAGIGGFTDIGKHTPFIDVPKDIKEGFGDFRDNQGTTIEKFKKAAGRLVGNVVVPQGLSQIAAAQDNNAKHSTEGFLQEIMRKLPSIPAIGLKGRRDLPPPKH